MTTVEALIAQLVSVAVVQGLLGWWIKARLESSIKHKYDRQLEQFKVELARDLERTRSREALSVEVAKRRVSVLAEAWEKIAIFEAQCWKQSKDTARRLLLEARSRGASGIPEELPADHKQVFDLLTEHMTVEIPDDRLEEIEVEGKADRDRLITASEDLDGFLTANRFWLGSDLDDELRAYSEQVKEAFLALAPAEEDRREFVRRLYLVRDKRWDARSIVPRLAGSE